MISLPWRKNIEAELEIPTLELWSEDGFEKRVISSNSGQLRPRSYLAQELLVLHMDSELERLGNQLSGD